MAEDIKDMPQPAEEAGAGAGMAGHGPENSPENGQENGPENSPENGQENGQENMAGSEAAVTEEPAGEAGGNAAVAGHGPYNIAGGADEPGAGSEAGGADEPGAGSEAGKADEAAAGAGHGAENIAGEAGSEAGMAGHGPYNMDGENGGSSGIDRQIKSIQEWMDAEENRPETPEERRRRERRERSKRIIAAVSDGLSALSNLYFTSQYAPDMYNHDKGGMTGAVDARIERLRAERKKEADKYLNYALAIGKLEEERDDKDYQRGRDALQDQLASIRAEYNAKLADIRYRRQQQELDKAEAAAEEREANRELDRQIKEARLEELRSRKTKNERWRPAGGGGGSGGSGSKGPKLQLEGDEPMRFDNQADYDRTVMRLAPDYNVSTTTIEVTERYEHGPKAGQPKKQQTIQRPVKDIAADIEREAAKRKKDSSRTTGSSTTTSSTTKPGGRKSPTAS